MGLQFSLNENYLKFHTDPALIEVLCFWCQWSYSETIQIDAIKSFYVRSFFGIPTADIVFDSPKGEKRLKISLARAPRLLLARLRQLKCLKDVKNEIQMNKFMHIKGMKSAWKDQIHIQEVPANLQVKLNLA